METSVEKMEDVTSNGEKGDQVKSTIFDDANIIKESGVEIFSPGHVFYNPVQEFNRDLTIGVIEQFARDFRPGGVRILEALGATGLRSIRFAKQLRCKVDKIVCNDFDELACQYIRRNIEHNNVSDKVEASCADASALMHYAKHGNKYDVVDIDPYGTPTPFLDAAVQAVSDGGLLCVTCTDMGVLCGNGAETCYAKYGSSPLRSKYCHEMALRIVLRCIESHANRYSKSIEPLLSISVDFYVRIFVRVHHGQLKVKQSCSKTAFLYHCMGCGTYEIQPLSLLIQDEGKVKYRSAAVTTTSGTICQHCRFTKHISGPFYNAPMHDPKFIYRLLETVKDFDLGTWPRIQGMLHMAAEELADCPFYHISDYLCSVVHCSPPRIMNFRSAILDAGYKVSFSHCAKNSLKTNAPNHVIWDIVRCWIKENPISKRRLEENKTKKSPAAAILSTEAEINVSFHIKQEANPYSRRNNLLRWQTNPTKDWGPQARAQINKLSLDTRRKQGIQKSHERRNKRMAEIESSDLKETDKKANNNEDSGDNSDV